MRRAVGNHNDTVIIGVRNAPNCPRRPKRRPVGADQKRLALVAEGTKGFSRQHSARREFASSLWASRREKLFLKRMQ